MMNMTILPLPAARQLQDDKMIEFIWWQKLDNNKLDSTQQEKIFWHWHVARIISSQKIYGLYGWKHHIVEMRGGVTDAGWQPITEDRATQPMEAGGRVSQFCLVSVYSNSNVRGFFSEKIIVRPQDFEYPRFLLKFTFTHYFWGPQFFGPPYMSINAKMCYFWPFLVVPLKRYPQSRGPPWKI